MKSYIKPCLILGIICLVTAFALSITYEVTNPIIIEQQKKADEKSRSEVLNGEGGFTKIEIDNKENPNILDVYKSNKNHGYVFTVKAKGYGGQMNVMVGIDYSGEIKGVKVTKQSETPGLGTKVAQKKYTDKYLGINIQNSDEVDAISGATISSTAFKSALSQANNYFNKMEK